MGKTKRLKAEKGGAEVPSLQNGWKAGKDRAKGGTATRSPLGPRPCTQREMGGGGFSEQIGENDNNA